MCEHAKSIDLGTIMKWLNKKKTEYENEKNQTSCSSFAMRVVDVVSNASNIDSFENI